MSDDIHANIRKRLGDRNLKVVADASGLSAHTLYRFMNGACEPRRSTVKLLEAYLQGEK